MSIAVFKSGGEWTLKYNNGDTLPTNNTPGYANMPDKSNAFNVDTLGIRFFNITTQTWTSES